MLKELGLRRFAGIAALDVLSRTKKLVVDGDGGIVSHELRDVGTLHHSSPACFLILLVAHGISLQMVADTGLQASSSTRLRECDFDGKVLRRR